MVALEPAMIEAESSLFVCSEQAMVVVDEVRGLTARTSGWALLSMCGCGFPNRRHLEGQVETYVTSDKACIYFHHVPPSSSLATQAQDYQSLAKTRKAHNSASLMLVVTRHAQLCATGPR
jgi:hypothetical protein